MLGTVQVMEVADQEVTVAEVVPNITDPVPMVVPKLVPAMITVAPGLADDGVIEVMAGNVGEATVRLIVAVCPPEVVTVTV